MMSSALTPNHLSRVTWRGVFASIGRSGETPGSAPSLSGWGWRWQCRTAVTRAADTPGSTDSLRTRSPKAARVEAVFFVADQPLSLRKLVQLATLVDSAEARQLIDWLNAAYDASGSPLQVTPVASGYQLLTRPQYAYWLGKLHSRQTELKLTPSALETLTIVAYRGPLTRAEIEQLRGVQCAEILKILMERGLVRIAGEDTSLGRPFLYETTRQFLELFGLASLDRLPGARDLRRPSRTTSTLPITPALPAAGEAA